MWRFEPATSHAPGTEPFRARGLAYVSALKYVDKRLPGGRAAFVETLEPAHARFYDQLFVVVGDYDISPLLRLFKVIAELERSPIDTVIEDRARWSGVSDSQGIWKPALSGATATDVARRLHFAFNRYFPPCDARPIDVHSDRFSGELLTIPAAMNGLYAASTAGFYRGALAGVGAVDVNVRWSPPQPAGRHAGVLIETLRFEVSWRSEP
jgi:hypothetical protein